VSTAGNPDTRKGPSPVVAVPAGGRRRVGAGASMSAPTSVIVAATTTATAGVASHVHNATSNGPATNTSSNTVLSIPRAAVRRCGVRSVNRFQAPRTTGVSGG
jgi:hypothetical protein